MTSGSRTIAGRYHLDKPIARGGLAEVYRARDDARAGATVAVKIIPPSALRPPHARERFDRDAQDLRQLQHPSIVRPLDHGLLPDGGGYLAMEFVEGEDLRHRLRREKQLGVAAALRILDEVCAGVDAAHRAGIIHGDLKPENIMLPADGTAARIVDFVGARRTQAEGSIIGTPAYMAPEQLRGEAPSPRGDVFSLGVVAFEMMTGALPFGRGSVGEVALAQAAGMPALHGTGIGRCLERAVLAALAFDPDRRPPSAAAFAQLLVSTRPT